MTSTLTPGWYGGQSTWKTSISELGHTRTFGWLWSCSIADSSACAGIT